MERPEWILFDYGQTLIRERRFDGLAGYRALMAYATKNRDGLSAEQVSEVATQLREEMGHNDAQKRIDVPVEVHHHFFQDFLAEYLGIEFSLDKNEVERVFWDAAAPGEATPGIAELLGWLDAQGIKTGVVSNLTFTAATLRQRIDTLLPNHHFAFLLASSEVVFRKPSRFIFELALRRAGAPAGKVWFCGDNFTCDIRGAAKAGMWPVWYRNAEAPEKVDFDYLHIRQWGELKAKLEKLG